MRKLLAVLVVTIGAVLFTPQARALPCPTSTPMVGFSHFQTCPDANGLVAFAYQVNSPTTVNSGTALVACSHFIDQVCINPDVGVDGDGFGDIELDWATGPPPGQTTGGVTGCPTTSGPQRVMVVITANDGSGLLLSVSGSSDPGYVADAAYPADPVSLGVLPLSCGPTGSFAKPAIVGTATPSSVTVMFPAPKIFSDCDSNSQGQLLFHAGFYASDPCADHFNTQPVAPGLVYTSVQLCGNMPSLDKSKWAATAVRPDAATGNATVVPPTVTQVATCSTAPSTCLCGYIGGTVIVNGVEGGSIVGFVETAGPLAASPKATDVSAKLSGGLVAVRFRTTTEVGLAGINILTNEKGKGLVLVTSVAPKGGGQSGASYTVDIKRGAFKSGSDVVVETVTSTGERFKSDAVKF